MSFFIFTLLYTYTYIINLIIYILSTLYLHIYSVFFKKQSFVKNIFIQNIINNSVNFLFVPKKLNGDKNNKNNFYNLYSKNNLVKYKYIYYINLYFNSIHTNHIYNYFSIYYSYNNCVVIKNNLNSFDNFRKNFLNNIYILKTGKLKNQKKHTHKIIYIFKNNYIYKLSLQVTTKYNKYITMYNISFSVSNIIKYLSKYNININFLRKNKVFNKGRYSRNRQTYRTGVY